MNTPNIPLPAGATTCGWDTINTDTGTPERSLQWFEQDAGDVGVNIDGWQQIDGTYTCGISVYGMSEGERIDGARARQLAARAAQRRRRTRQAQRLDPERHSARPSFAVGGPNCVHATGSASQPNSRASQ